VARMRTQDFEKLYEEHARPLFSFLVYRTGDVTLAEDLVADTFERVLTAKRPFNARRASEKTWIYSIALNRLRDIARRSAVERGALEQMHASSDNGHQNGFEYAELRHVVMGALNAVSDEEREALSLRYGGDLSLSEIAQVIRKPRSTVEGRLYKGLTHLRAELERQDADAGHIRAVPG
jgi:RNA polymerase sigma-70 factor, ECF subfamily